MRHSEMSDLPEYEWGVTVWLNPHHINRPQSRLLQTIVDSSSGDPMAFPIKTLQLALENPILPTSADIESRLLASTKDSPLIIPVSMAREWLGWDDFRFTLENTESE